MHIKTQKYHFILVLIKWFFSLGHSIWVIKLRFKIKSNLDFKSKSSYFRSIKALKYWNIERVQMIKNMSYLSQAIAPFGPSWTILFHYSKFYWDY